MTITIQSNTDTILELPGLPGTLGPGKTTTLPAMTEDLVRAIDLGLLLVPSGAEAPEGLPPVVFDHQYPHALPISADRAYYVRVLRSPSGFHDGTGLRDFVAYYGDGDGMSCAFSDDGISWDNEKEVTGIAANGYHVVCALEAPDRLRILYWDPDVPNQPYAMAGLRTAVCNPQADSSVFTEDAVCTGNLVTEGTEAVWNRGHYGPSFLWYNPKPTSITGKPFTWRYAMFFIASTGGNDSLGLGHSDDGLDWQLYGDTPVISGLIDLQSWEGENGYISACHVERHRPTAAGGCCTPVARRETPASVTPGPGTVSTGQRLHSIPYSRRVTGRSSNAATRPASSLTLTAPCFFTAPRVMKIPTGSLFRVSGHLRSAGRTCSGPIIWVRDSRPADRFSAAKAPRRNGTRPSPVRPWETSGSTPTSPAVVNGRNMLEQHGNEPDLIDVRYKHP